MRDRMSCYRLCAVLIAVCGLMVLAASPAEAGRAVRKSDQHATGRHGGAVHHHRHFKKDRFAAKRFKHRRSRGNVVRRAERPRRHYHLSRYPYGYSSSYGYGAYSYGGGSSYGYPEAAPRYRSERRAPVQPVETKPVTPKWVHVGDDVSNLVSDGSTGESAGRTNCLTVKTEITVNGKPVDAFGEACLLADGRWELRPAQTQD